MILLATLTILLMICGVGIAALCRPRSVSAWIVLSMLGAWSAAVVLVDGVGRVRYDRSTVLLGAFVFAVLGIVSFRSARRDGAGMPPRVLTRLYIATQPFWMRGFLLLWIGIMLYSAAAIWVMPASVPDVLRYHLPMSVAWMREGQVGVVTELDYRANFFPHGVQLLTGLTILMRGDDKLSAFPQLALSGVLFPLVCYAFSRVCGLRRRFAAASAILASLCVPVVLQMRHEVSDVGHYAALLLAVALAFDGVRSSPRICARPWIAMALASGLALGTKSSGPLVLGCLGGAWVLGHLIRERLNPLSIIRPAFLTRSFAILFVSILIGGWVFIGNLIEHGNPVYPMIMSFGPITLPGPDPISPINANQWIYDFSKSPLERLVGGVARWPDLMLSLPERDYYRAPDFRDNRSPTNSGFGYVTAACTLLAGVFMLAASVKFVIKRRIPRRGAAWIGILIVLGVYNAAYLALVSLITAPDSTVDARYQIHLAFVVALISAGAMGYVWRRHLSAIVMYPMLVLSVYVVVLLVGYDITKGSQDGVPQPHRGWKAFSRMVDRDLPRSWAWTGRPFFLSNEPDELFELLEGEEAILLLGRGKSYPFMINDPDRRVLTVGAQGPDLRADTMLGTDPDITEQYLEMYNERWQLSDAMNNPDIPQNIEALEAHRERWPKGLIMKNTRRYYLEAARENNARYLISTAGRYISIGGNGETVPADPHWELVYVSEHRSGRLETAVYRLREENINSDDFGIDPEYNP